MRSVKQTVRFRLIVSSPHYSPTLCFSHGHPSILNSWTVISSWEGCFWSWTALNFLITSTHSDLLPLLPLLSSCPNSSQKQRLTWLKGPVYALSFPWDMRSLSIRVQFKTAISLINSFYLFVLTISSSQLS